MLSIFGLSNKAQTTTSEVATNHSQNNYVFEGTIESVVLYPTDKDENIISKKSARNEGGVNYFYQKDGSLALTTSNAKIKISKIYKGSAIQINSEINLVASSNEVTLYFGGIDSTIKYINNSSGHGSNNTMISPTAVNEKMIFFCEKDKNGNFYLTDIKSLVTFNRFYEENIKVTTEPVIYAQGFGKSFYSRNELLDFLKNEKQLSIPSSEYTTEKKSLNASKNVKENNLSTILEENTSRSNAWLKLRPAKSINIQQNKVLANDITISITGSRILDSASFKWFEFDVSIIANNGSIYFDSFLADVQYNSSAFGTNVVANNNIVAIVDPAFASPTYTNPSAFWSDNASNIFRLPFGTASSGPYNRILCPTTLKKALTIRLKIQNCNVLTNIQFTNVAFTGSFCYYTTTANAPLTSSLPFDNGFYNGAINDITCKPIITGFTDNVPAGINRNVTITGKYFGKKKGNGTVFFRNADQGSQYPPVIGPNGGGLQQYDILFWQDDKIIIRLPTIIDSAVATFGAEPPKIGSGYFKVKNSFLVETQSTSSITIPFAIRQQPVVQPITSIPYKKYTVNLASNNGNGYKIQMHTNLTSNTTYTAAKAVIKRAMKAWSCMTNVNWFLGNDTTLNFNQDGICVINLSSASGLMQTHPEIRPCLASNGEPIFYLKSFDIEINQTPSSGVWKVDTVGPLAVGELDFYAAIQHELGHGHLVQHINDSIKDIMWWQAYPFGATQAQRKNLLSSFGASDGGNFVIDSLIGNLTCVSNHIDVAPSKCEEFVGIKKLGYDLFHISVFPNPSYLDEEIKIKFNLEKEEEVYFEIYDITGKRLIKTPIEKFKEVEYSLPTKQISEGVYLLIVNVGAKKQTMKIIKQ